MFCHFYNIVLLLFIISLVLAYSASGLECKIYVSSSDGINNTSCWTGGVQTPCATIDLAIQGTTATGVRHNCSSVTIVYLYPAGNNTLEAIELQPVQNSVSMVGNTALPVSILDNNAVSLDDCPIMTVNPINKHIFCPALLYDADCYCDKFVFTVSVTDCKGVISDWRNDLHVCVSDSVSQIPVCSNESIKSVWQAWERIHYGLCAFCDTPSDCDPRCRNLSDISTYFYFEVPSCYDNISIAPTEVEMTLNVSTLGQFQASTITKLNVTIECSMYSYVDSYDYERCSSNPVCVNQEYCPFTRCSLPLVFLDGNQDCYSSICQNHSSLCTVCSSGYGVSINKINKCTHCEDYPINILVFIGIEIIPMTLMVLLIIIFNIQLTNGSMNGLVFYSQTIFVIFSDYVFMSFKNQMLNLYLIPCNAFNLDFTLFLGNYSLCIIPNMSPLGAVSFWYVIGFYPLLLLLLLYLWITLYDKGYKCVVLVTRPFHRCMARFWSMTGIEPSFTHSIASIYILCFTQLAGTSFKLLRCNSSDFTEMQFFFYDSSIQYFHGIHAVASSFAIFVLLTMILLPTLYVQLYPFKWFHKLLECLHLRKQLLISLGDVFTGPYKNGTENTFDYRFLAGLYLIARMTMFVLSTIFININPVDLLISGILSLIQGCIALLLTITILVFRPFKRNIHNFSEAMLLIFKIGFLYFLVNYNYYDDLARQCIILNVLLFGMILPIYIMYHIIKIILNCINYYKLHNPTVPANTEEQKEETQALVIDDWTADRMENPLEYNEQHVPGTMDQHRLSPDIKQSNYDT